MTQRKVSTEGRINRWGYFFVFPFVVVYFLFIFYPTLYTFALAFTDSRGFAGLAGNFSFNGLENFIKLVQDENFWGAVSNTFIMWVWNFIPQLGIALLVSIWLSDVSLHLKGKALFRAVIYLPNLLTAASVAMLFRSLFGFPTGPINQFLNNYLGVFDTVIRDGVARQEAFDFFRNVTMSRGIVSFIQWWMWFGHTVIFLMAGITAIPTSLYESASVDGANSRQAAWHITLPLLRPMMLFILITSMIGGMQMLEIPFLLTDMRGAPNFKIRTSNVYIYNQAFQGVNNYGYAAAISVGVFIITILLAVIIYLFLQDRSDLVKAKKGGNT